MSEEVKKTIPEHSFRCRFEHKSIFIWKDITTDMMFKDKKIVIFDTQTVDIFRNDKQISVTDDIEIFFKSVDMIIANRLDKTLIDHKDKLIFSRDIFNEN